MQDNRLINHPWEGNSKYIFSSVNDFHHYGKDKSNATGLKYVLKGEERYKLYNKTHLVKQGSCLVVNEDQLFDIHIKKNPLPAEGICVSLDNKLLNDIYSNFIFSDEKLADEGVSILSGEFQFCETVFGADDVLCNHLHSLGKFLDKQTGQLLLPPEEIFYGLAGHLLLSQSFVRKQAMRIRALRYSTKMELFKRVNIARQQIEDDPGLNLSISTLAASCSMSEFHFFRTFRELFGISPLQYKLKVRMERAKAMLESTSLPVYEVAISLGFADVQSFCKSFKKYFDVSPGKFREEEERSQKSQVKS